MKRTLALLTALIMLALCVPRVYAREEDKKQPCRGVVRLSYEFERETELEINGKRYAQADVSENCATVRVTASGVDYTCGVFVNGTMIGTFVSGGDLAVPGTLISEGANEITLRPETGSGYYNTDLIYGKFNEDDFELLSFELLAADGEKIAFDFYKYMPIANSAGVTPVSAEYNGKSVKVGDGWIQETYMGGNTPDVPVMVGMRFESGFNSGKIIYEIDTTELPEGENVIKFYVPETGKYLDETDTIIVNNQAPRAEIAFAGREYLTSNDDLTITFSDSVSGFSKAYVTLDDRKVYTAYKAGEYDLSSAKISDGRHTLCVYTKDKLGNEGYAYAFFEYASNAPVSPVYENGAISGEGDIYGARLIKNINLYLGGNAACGDALGCTDERLAAFDEMDDGFSPYQSFLIDLEGVDSDTVYINCTSQTGNGGKYAVLAWNYAANEWEKLAAAASGTAVTVPLVIKESGYASGDKARVRIAPELIGNGSDTILWHTDTQYYSTFDDLNFLYQSISEYTVEQYKAGNIAYALYTGDFVDDARTREEAEKEYAVADKMQKIIDDAGVPNGVLAGNHDVEHDKLNYEYYHKYFPASRYSSQECFGGAINQNECHYDLISLGGYDFVILCFGYGKNADPDTVAWANAVLKAYPNRNAILATHEYINAQGMLLSDKARTMLNEIAFANENVKMILCGHSEGACSQWREVPGSDRKILEILHDYQFAELNRGPQHIINNCTCDGEGFVRLLTVTTSGQLVFRTYSPYYDIENYYAQYIDNNVYQLDLISNTQTVKTSAFRVAYGAEKTDIAEGYDVCFAVSENVYSDFTLLNDDFANNSYKTAANPDQTVTTPYDNTYGEIWYAGCEPTLFIGSNGDAPSADVAEKAVDLIPPSASALTRTSGTSTFAASIDENRALHLMPTTNECNWVTVVWKPENANISEYPYLYFSVSVPYAVKWGMCLNTSSGKRLHFALDLYEKFGYKDYSMPSDLYGSMYGYLDLSKLIPAGDTLRQVNFTAAVQFEEVTFNYAFLGKPKGCALTFVSGDAVRRYDAAQGADFESPGEPYIAGKRFVCWEDEDGNEVSFPIKPSKDQTFTAVYEDVPEYVPECRYYTEELPMAEVIPSGEAEESSAGESGSGCMSAVTVALIAAAALAVCMIAAVLIAKKKKQKAK